MGPQPSYVRLPDHFETVFVILFYSWSLLGCFVAVFSGIVSTFGHFCVFGRFPFVFHCFLFFIILCLLLVVFITYFGHFVFF